VIAYLVLDSELSIITGVESSQTCRVRISHLHFPVDEPPKSALRGNEKCAVQVLRNIRDEGALF
jgi:hypothetical protein